MFNSDSGESEVVETWQRFVQGLLGVLALVGAGLMAHYYAPPDTTGLEQQVHQLSRQVADLERQQSVSAAAVDDARDSVAYFPGSPLPVNLETAVLAKHGDLAVLRLETTAFTKKLRPLTLSQALPHVGESVSVLAYPMGVTGMVAKSPAIVYERLSSHPDNAQTAAELAALSLIRPSATFGHIGDVTGDKLIYDAPTA